ncbi:MAG: hypothetical protein WCO13_07585 [Bacteroidota bacterium]
MNIQIKEVASKKDLMKFIRFPYTLYENNPFWVPALDLDEKVSLSRTKNPAFEFCIAKYWLAYKDGEIVGRIAGIFNKRANECWKENRVRFGWFDFIDDVEVAETLLKTVENWGKDLGCVEIHGPLGFTDMDREGMLVYGFDQLATYATLYNHEYYPKIIEQLGYNKDVDWIQFEYDIPKERPERLRKMAGLIAKRYNLHTLSATKTKQLIKYAHQIFEVLNQSYASLYGFYPLSEKQIELFTKQYIGYVKPEFVSVVLNDNDEVVAFGITMPSLSKAVQKAKGRLLPFGWWDILKSLNNPEILDMYLIAVRPDMQNKGVNAMIFDEIMTNCIKKGVKTNVINPVLEENKKMHLLWEDYQSREPHIRRRCFIKKID